MASASGVMKWGKVDLIKKVQTQEVAPKYC